MKNTIIVALAISFGLTAVKAAEQQAAQQGAPTVKTGSALQSKANSPTPPAAAKNKSQKTAIGKGKASAKASAPSSYWTEEIDVHDDGTAETTEFLYDAQRGIVYAYGEDDFACANGNPERGGILEAVYAAGNKGGKPVGSGYYIVGLNAGQCAMKKAGAYGCKFDANGNPTECGAISVNDATGEVTVAVIQ
jgi:type II secretory pathway pseudopilin PulG